MELASTFSRNYHCPKCKSVYAKSTQILLLSEAFEKNAVVLTDAPGHINCDNCGVQIRMNDIVTGKLDHLTHEEKDERQLGVWGMIGILGTIITLMIFSDFPWIACIFVGMFFGIVPGALLYQLSKLFRTVILLVASGAALSANAQEPYTKFIGNNAKINWAAEYRTIVNLTPVTNTVSLKRYYQEQIQNKGLMSYTVENRKITDSNLVKSSPMQRQEWLKDHFVRPSDHPDRWEYRSKKAFSGYRISGFSNDACCGCDEADAFLVNQLLIYSGGRFSTRNIYLSPLCLRKIDDERAAWYPAGIYAWNVLPSKTSSSTFLTKSNVTYNIDPYDSTYELDLLTLGDNRLINHLLKDVGTGKIAAQDHESGQKIGYKDLLTWQMPFDTVAVYDDDFTVASYRVVQKVLDPSDISFIRLEQDWYYDFKLQKLFSEVRSATLLVRKELPDGRLIGLMPYIKLTFKRQ